MQQLDKSDLITAVADRAGFTKSDTKILLDAMVEVIQEVLEQGGSIKWMGFLKAYVTKIKSYEGYDPFEDKRMIVPERKRVVFRTSKVIDNAVNGEFTDEELETDE